MAAFNQAVANLDEVSDTEMQKLTGGVSFPGLFLMAESNALPLVLLAEQFAKLPGIGMKSAQRPCLLCYVHDRRGRIGFCSGYH